MVGSWIRFSRCRHRERILQISSRGGTVLAIVDAILSGERDPGKLAKDERQIRVSQQTVMNSFHFDLDRMLLDKAKVRSRREMRAGTFVNVESLFRKAGSWVVFTRM